MDNINLTVESWPDYELIDSGDNKKLECYGEITVIRPETQALWHPAKPEEWKKAQAEFSSVDGKGAWNKKDVPDSWNISWNDINFTLKLAGFKHTGVFPEQEENWKWIREKVSALENPNILNLFGYTGIASIVAAKAGGRVTHVDASKQSNLWSKNNAELSGVSEGIRYILDDALKFVKREVRRGAIYDGIILDPPAFGRGAKGEVWHIENDLPELLETLKLIHSKNPGAFFLLNGYAAGYSPLSFMQLMNDYFKENKGEFGELRIKESNSERCISSGIYVRFVR